MTNFNFNASVNLSLNASLNLGGLVEGASIGLGNGITGSFFNPLPTNNFTFAQLGSAFEVALGTLIGDAVAQSLEGSLQFTPAEPPITATLGQNGTGSIDLGDGYTLSLDQNNSQVTITDKATGQTTTIWGDPHVDVNGKAVFNFAGTTTFKLADGTNITVNTTPWAGNPNAYTANQLVITRGNQAVVVNNLSQNKTGQLSITQSDNGYALRANTNAGYQLDESKSGWVSELTGHVATQDDMNATMPGGAFGPGSQPANFDFAGAMIGSFLMGEAFAGLSLGIAAAETKAVNKIEHQVERAISKMMVTA